MRTLHLSPRTVDVAEKILIGGLGSAVTLMTLITAGILFYMGVLA